MCMTVTPEPKLVVAKEKLTPTTPVPIKPKSTQALMPWWLSPIVPKSEESFVAFLFWHSIVLTFTTPLSRVFKESFDAKLIVATIANYLGISQKLLGRPAQDTYLAYPPSTKIDKAFIPHAVCGLIWLVAAYFHICHSRHLKTKAVKRVLSIFALVSLLLHVTCALFSLIINPVNHKPLPWLFLFSSIVPILVYFGLGLHSVLLSTTKNRELHKIYMTKCFLYSIEGAGTIRTVAATLFLFDAGPHSCQAQHEGSAFSCGISYVNRMLCIRLLTTVYLGLLAAMQTRRGDPHAWRHYVIDSWDTVLFSLVIFLVFAVFGTSGEDTINAVLSPFGHRYLMAVFIQGTFAALLLSKERRRRQGRKRD